MDGVGKAAQAPPTGPLAVLRTRKESNQRMSFEFVSVIVEWVGGGWEGAKI